MLNECEMLLQKRIQISQYNLPRMVPGIYVNSVFAESVVSLLHLMMYAKNSLPATEVDSSYCRRECSSGCLLTCETAQSLEYSKFKQHFVAYLFVNFGYVWELLKRHVF